jgi:hypothetical protein
MLDLLNCLNKGKQNRDLQDGQYAVINRQKSRPMRGRLGGFSECFTYLQFAQVHVEPQLQLTQVQLGLLHFTF